MRCRLRGLPGLRVYARPLVLCLLAVGCSSGGETAPAPTDTGPQSADVVCTGDARATCAVGDCKAASDQRAACAAGAGCTAAGPCATDKKSTACWTCESEAETACESTDCKPAYETWDACIIAQGCAEMDPGGGHWTSYDEPCAEEKCPSQVAGLDQCLASCPGVTACAFDSLTDAACIASSCKAEDDALNQCLTSDCAEARACK